MNYIEIIEFICTIISTLSIIFSAIVICKRFLSKISIYVLIENCCLKLYAVALHRKMMLCDLKIKVKGKVVNANDNYFNGGKENIVLDVDDFKLIKMVQLDDQLKGFAIITIDTKWDGKIWGIFRIRRK